MIAHALDYPRPQMARPGWINLNGKWDYMTDDAGSGEAEEWYRAFPSGAAEILVPFAPETAMSGIGDETHHSAMWYSRSFTVLRDPEKRLLLHFEGVDFTAKVWVNGIFIGEHRGGYARFSFDITDVLTDGENILTVKAEDSAGVRQPRGKQRWKRDSYGCWYVQTTGIWKTVWMESVPKLHIAGLKITPDIRDCSVRIEAEIAGFYAGGGLAGGIREPEWLGTELTAEIRFEGQSVRRETVSVDDDHVTMTVSVLNRGVTEWGVREWTPDEPNLYGLVLTLAESDGEDRVESYFGMRDVAARDGKILLNGRPVYEKLILDQGYWKDSHLTPPDEQALVDDIDKIKAMGFNGLRKHMKIEDERFLYWCDVKGMLVWSEMPAAYEFDDTAVQEFTSEWMEIVRQNYSHPSIVTWTPFNESWGVPGIRTEKPQQHFTEAVYYLTKAFDPMRPVITNDGWEHTVSDILTLHDYEERGEVFLERYADHLDEITADRIYHCKDRPAYAWGYGYHGQPVILSEYGGIAFSGGASDSWGYGNRVNSEEEFLARYMCITDAVKKVPYITGYCYTQVSDVQQEVNGLLDADHNYKVAPEKIRAINEHVPE